MALPLLLLHAGVADRRMWDPVRPLLGVGRRVLAPDLTGFGEAPFPDGEFSHVDELVALLDRERVERAVLVGASFGGQVAIDLALSHPDRAAALVLAASALGGWAWSDTVETFGAREDELLEAGDVDAAVELNLSMWLDGRDRGADEVEPGLRTLVGEMQRRAFEHALRAFESEPHPVERRLDPPAAGRLGELRVPTLVVLGGRDAPDFAAIAERLREEAGARVVVFGEAAHLPSLEQPERFASVVLEFLAQIG